MEADQQTENRSKKRKRFLAWVLLLISAGVFLFSGISKLYSFDYFIWNIMDAGVGNPTFAGILARLLIGVELLLGLFLATHLFLKSFAYPASILLLLFFTGYLLWIQFARGGTENCGCFGQTWEMSSSTAIAKNLILIIALWVSRQRLYAPEPYRHSGLLAGLLGMASFLTPFLVFPPSGDTQPVETHRPIDLTPLYDSSRTTDHPPEINLRKGKHIVAFMSLTCPHCRKAAFLIQILHRQHPDFPFFFILIGHPDLLDEFFEETHSDDVPHILFRDVAAFQQMAGSAVPAIYWIHDSVIERKANYFQMHPTDIQAWLKNP